MQDEAREEERTPEGIQNLHPPAKKAIDPQAEINPDLVELYTDPEVWSKLTHKKKLEVCELKLLAAMNDSRRGAGHRLAAINKMIDHLQKENFTGGTRGATGGGAASQPDRFGEELDGFQ